MGADVLKAMLPHAMTSAAFSACIFAAWKGGPSERLGAAVIGCTWLLSLITYPLLIMASGRSGYFMAPYFAFGIDALGAVGLLVVALRYSKLWIGLAVLIQALALAIHAGYLMSDGPTSGVGAVVYISRVNLLGAALILVLFGGTVAAWLRNERANRTTSAEGGDGLTGQAFDPAPVPVAHRLVRR